jgi:NifU-like protein
MSDLLREHFLNPKNVGIAGEPSFTGRSGSFVCGATAHLSIQIDESHNISAVKFKAAGCEVLVAVLSILTQRINGQSSAEAALIGQAPDVLIEEFEIAVDKKHCVQLACESLVAAIRAYSEAARIEWNGDEALICTCFFVSEKTIEREIKLGNLTTVREVTNACNAGGGCGSCQPLIVEILETTNGPCL